MPRMRTIVAILLIFTLAVQGVGCSWFRSSKVKDSSPAGFECTRDPAYNDLIAGGVQMGVGGILFGIAFSGGEGSLPLYISGISLLCTGALWVLFGSGVGCLRYSACSRELEKLQPIPGLELDQREYTGTITVRTDLVDRTRKVESPMEGKGGVEWIYSSRSGIQFTRSEVTVDQYRKCVDSGSCKKPIGKDQHKHCNWGYTERDRHPINCVDFAQAAMFCVWAEGRLPTYAEWYAEASDNGKRKYPWGNSKVNCSRAVWGDGKETNGCEQGSTWSVCSLKEGNSVSGLCDMAGNVSEWTSSVYDKDHDFRIVKGGSWSDDNPDSLRTLPMKSWIAVAWYIHLSTFPCLLQQ